MEALRNPDECIGSTAVHAALDTPKKRRERRRKGVDRRYFENQVRPVFEAEMVAHTGGEDAQTPVLRALIRRWVTLNLRAEAIEQQAARGQPIDMASYIAIVDRLHGLAKTFGLRRAARPAMDLHEYMRQQAAQETSPPPLGAEPTGVSAVVPRAGHAVAGDGASELDEP